MLTRCAGAQPSANALTAARPAEQASTALPPSLMNLGTRGRTTPSARTIALHTHGPCSVTCLDVHAADDCVARKQGRLGLPGRALLHRHCAQLAASGSRTGLRTKSEHVAGERFRHLGAADPDERSGTRGSWAPAIPDECYAT